MRDIFQIPNFVSTELEQELINYINQVAIPAQQYNVHNHRESVMRYGSKIPYGDNHFVSEEIPDIYKQFLVGELDAYDSVSVNKYLPGQVIPWHVDSDGSGLKIWTLSLGSNAMLKFRIDRKKSVPMGMAEHYLFELKARGLFGFEGTLRWSYEHFSQAVDVRYSIVFRKAYVE